MNSIVRAVRRAPDVSADAFRGAMRELAGGVSVVTAGQGNDISGMTVTSLTSLSAEPPRLMVSVNRQASSFPLIVRYGFFGVSVLSASQQEVAERFSDRSLKGHKRFAGADWITLASKVPLLKTALVAIDCEVEEIIERHSHAIIIGRLLDLRSAPDHSGLAYWQGHYVAIDRDQDMSRLADVSLPSSRALWQV